MDPKSGKSSPFDLGRGPAGHDRVMPLERMPKNGEPGTRGVYSLVTGQAKWKSRLRFSRRGR